MVNHSQPINMNTVLNTKLELWKQMQSMVMEVEKRNFNAFSISTIISIIFSGLSDLQTHWDIIICFIPALMLFALFQITFNNKTSALIRGYLSGIEDEINSNIQEDLFLWNKKYQHLRNGKYFVTNQLSFAMYAIFVVPLFLFSFMKMYNMLNAYSWNENEVMKTLAWFLWFAYLGVTLVFAIIFSIEENNNGKSKIFARIYFHLHNSANGLLQLLKTDSPDDITDERLAEMTTLYKRYKTIK